MLTSSNDAIFFVIKQSLWEIFTFSPVLPLLEFSTLNGTKQHPYTPVHIEVCYSFHIEDSFFPLSLKSVTIGKNISLYTEALLLKLWHVHFSFYCYDVQYMWCICVWPQVKMQFNRDGFPFLFSWMRWSSAPFFTFSLLYFISVCWCSTVSWMQDRYCTKLYCYWTCNKKLFEMSFLVGLNWISDVNK